MWLLLAVVLHGPAQQFNLDFYCVLLRIALLSRFLPEAMNLPPDERGGVWGKGDYRGRRGLCVCACVGVGGWMGGSSRNVSRFLAGFGLLILTSWTLTLSWHDSYIFLF